MLSICQKLPAADYTAPLPTEEVLRAATLYVNDYEGELTARMQAPEEGTLYRVSAKGELERLNPMRDGSYLVFPLENGGSVVYARSGEPERSPYLIPAAAAGGAALLIAAAALRKRKKKRSAFTGRTGQEP